MPALSGYSGSFSTDNIYSSGSYSGSGSNQDPENDEHGLGTVSYVLATIFSLFLIVFVIACIFIIISEIKDTCFLNVDNYIMLKKNTKNTKSTNGSCNLELYNCSNIKLDTECSICIQKDETKAVKLECGHSFHKECLDKWVKECIFNIDGSPRCPLCNEKIKLNINSIQYFINSQN